MTSTLAAEPREGRPVARTLLSAKLTPPILRGDAVGRHRLLALLERVQPSKLALIQAPAGYGKTTLMAQWFKHLRDAGEGVAWINVDEADNDTARLLSCLQASLVPNGEHDSLEMLALINRCASDHERFTLFLDEVEALRDAQPQKLLELLLDYSPANVRIVMGTRSTPVLPLARLRMRQELLEVTAQDLRFLREEAARFLYARCGVQLAKATLDRLLETTEGWPAALQLVALSLVRGEDRSSVMQHLSSSRSQLIEYLVVDVLGNLHDEMRRFLLETSVLRRLCAPLCEAVTGSADGAAMLARLETANLFIQPLDGTREWYRYHALFAEVLQAELQQKRPGRAAEIARSASDWCAANGLLGESVEYSLQAQDTANAMLRMEQCVDEQIRIAQFHTVRRWLGKLPRADIERHPRLVIANAWALTFGQEFEQARQSIDQLHRLSQDPQTSPGYRKTLLVLEPILLMRLADVEKSIALAEAARAEIGRDSPFEWGHLATNLAYGYVLSGRQAEVQTYLREMTAALASARPANVFGLAYFAGTSGISESSLGNLHGAIHLFRSIEKIVAEHTGAVFPHLEPGSLPAQAMGFCAELLYEQNEIDEAEDWLDRYFRFVESTAVIECVVLTYLTRVRIHLSRDERVEADDLLIAASRHAARNGIHRLSIAVEWERVRTALVRGEVDRARVIARSTETRVPADSCPSFVLPHEEVNGAGIETIRLQIHDGSGAQALTALRTQTEHAAATLRRRRLAKLHILEGLALDALDQREAALGAMLAAVRLATTMGAVRMFVDEGPICWPLLKALGDDRKIRADKRLSAHLSKILAAFGADDVAAAVAAPAEAKAGGEPLSAREVQILERLGQGYSNLAVAQQLFLSTNTVKWHLRQIYEKLGANNRNQAIFLARQAGFLT